ncbi:endonuclease domain-containing protein [Streptomyces sp. NPDC007875]|uniref:endonuclease domain-containing protein n=1 Tax=Streptomyces sp. NPDC007875 TaxID=3364783 RepID=UPI003677EE03
MTHHVVEEPRACRSCHEVKPADDFYRHQGGRRVHCKGCMRKRDRARYAATNGKDRVFDLSLRRLYGITLEQYKAKAAEQEGKCGICQEVPDTDRRMHVDHDHATGQLRDLLCHHCNLLLGNAKDSIERLRQGIAYLERHSALAARLQPEEEGKADG